MLRIEEGRVAKNANQCGIDNGRKIKGPKKRSEGKVEIQLLTFF